MSSRQVLILDYTNLKEVQVKGSVYSDYNCGSIKTTECNKNLASWGTIKILVLQT